ncbi:MAG: hypothetical protein FD143_2269 [Ignavibacteria bacterium]|nr:MAG: hypothetical protein FD143_2269 [Ignavibacteria bacterium]KAF0159555.1 MAG: hypothetical protein FD188_2156 [Ignavibacteria bacterium]
MIEKSIEIKGMSCNHCVTAVKKELSKLQLELAEVNIGSIKIIYDETKTTDLQIESAIAEAGFEAVK